MTKERNMNYTGGCQCGKVRYAAEPPRDRASVCYCRMCQKASGGPFMAFVRFPARQIRWTHAPAIFASSNLVERGFCAACGTPLTYRVIDSPFVSLTLNSLDDPQAVQPEMRFSPEAELLWCRTLADLPVEEASIPDPAHFINHQR